MRQLPFQGTLWLITFLQLLSLYEVRPWLDLSFASAVVPFCFFCFALSAIIFSLFQGSSRGRAVTVAQRGLLFISGIILALQTIFRYVGLRYTGPLQTILGEYAGAVIGSLFFKPLTQRIEQSGKTRALLASGIVIFLLSQGWTATSCSPLSFSGGQASALASDRSTGKELRVGKVCGNLFPVVAATLAGFLSSISRSMSAQVALRTMSKKQYFLLNYRDAALVLLPWTLLLVIFQGKSVVSFSMAWPLATTVALGMMLAFFGDSFSVVSPSSTWHYFVSICCLFVLDLFFNMDFCLLGSLLCTILLGLAVGELTHAAKGLANDASASYNIASVFQPVAATAVTAVNHIVADPKSRKIAMFLLINTSYMIVEFTYGILSNSLGLISDACHMLFDCAALAVGLYAAYISRRPANAKFNYGYGRFEVLSAYANAVFLVLVAALIVLESLERMLDPPEISTESLLLVSVGGLVVNIIGLLFFHEAHHHAHGESCSHAHEHDDIHSRSLLVGPKVGKLGHVVKQSEQHQMGKAVCSSGNHQHHHRMQASNADDQIQGHFPVQHSIACCSPEVAVGGGTLESRNQHQHEHNTWDADQHNNPGYISAFEHAESMKQCRSHQTSGSCEHPYEQHDSEIHSPHSTQELKNGYYAPETVDKVPDYHHHEHVHRRHHDTSFTKDESGGKNPGRQSVEGWNQTLEVVTDGRHHHSEHHHDCQHHDQRSHVSPRLQGRLELGSSHHHIEQRIQVESHEEHEHHHHHHHQNHNCHSHHHHDDHRDNHAHYVPDSSHHHHAAQGDMNLEGVFLHVLADTLGSVGVVVSTLLLKYKGWVLADAVCSIFISGLVVASVIPLLRATSDILRLRIPKSAEIRIAKSLEELKNLQGLHHCQRIHIWSLTSKETVGSVHAYAVAGADKDILHNQVSQLLRVSGVSDITVQIEEAS